ncbi:MAG: HU family DNA-binding protein [Candidatus Neomarinimicrobiota bacterium]
MIRSELMDLLEDRPGLTKSELIHFLARNTGLTKVETETIVDGLLGTVQEVLTMGKKVELRGFGTFLVRIRQPREARNPATQETVRLDRRSVPVFKPSKTLRIAVDQALQPDSVQ